MGAEDSLRPVVVPTTHAPKARNTFRWRGAAVWVGLLCMGAAQPLSGAQDDRAGEPCTISQKKPLFVAFGRGVGLERFEDTALFSRAIVRQVKRWACEDVPGGMALSSLRLALAGEGVSLERVQFDDAELKQASVLLAGAAQANEPLRWRVYLARAEDDSWSVLRSHSK